MRDLSIITINRNNAEGLEKTLKSVLLQSCSDFEYVIIDGASTDNSVVIIRKYEHCFGGRLKWISEPDIGIYNAMNKGIGIAGGEYVIFLNSGDCMATENVVENLYFFLRNQPRPSIVYGNLLKDIPIKGIVRDKGFEGRKISFLDFYNGTMNHSSSFISKNLFMKYGLYDETLKIVADWKWFLQAIALGEESPVYWDMDVTLFDMNGISATNRDLDQAERRRILEELIPAAVLADYDRWAAIVRRVERVKRYPVVYKCFGLIERCLFRMEKKTIR